MDSPSPVADSNDSDTLSYTSARSGADDDALADALNLLVIQQPLPLPSTIPPLPVQPETLRDPQAVSAHSSDGPDSPTRPQSVPSSPLLPPLLPANLAAIPPPAVPSPSQTPRPSPSRRTAVIFQEACTKHRYSRNTDIGSIVERPERIRAVKTGVASAWARLESRSVAHGGSKWEPAAAGVEDLDALMLGLAIKDNKGKGKEVLGGPFDILFSTAILPVNDPALLFIHPLPNLPPTDATPPPPRPPSPPAPAPAKLSTPGRQPPSTPPSNKNLFLSHPIPASAPPKLASRKYDLLTPPAWPTQLQTLCRNAASAVLSPPYSEIPPHLPQGDLYLSEGSEEAIFGALGAVCEGVDRVVEGARSEDGGYDRAFVAIRPPGHHCCEASPMGFCFVNNVGVAAAHAHQRHGIDRVIVLDIDLHHGNGTQDIAWRINAAAQSAIASTSSPRKGSPVKAKRRELQVMYASLHDVFSYPCEDGDPALVQAASLVLSGGHSQYISNVHLESWERESEFHERLYPRYIEGLLGAATEFCKKTTARDEDDSERTIVILSAGFDASEHESQGMSRHRRNVPTSFYHRFARDVVKFANTYSSGKVLSVLEGGYSDRALASGTLAMMIGLTEAPRIDERTFVVGDGEEREWWEEKVLAKLEKGCKARKGGKGGSATPTLASSTTEDPTWLARTVEIFSRIEGAEMAYGGPQKEKKEVGRTMQLRQRKGRGEDEVTPQGSPMAKGRRGGKSVATTPAVVERPVVEAPPPSKIKFVWKEGGMGGM